jgi:hypothetical protein
MIFVKGSDALRALLMLLAVVLGAHGAAAQVDLTGHWVGSVEISKGPSRVSMDLARNPQGVWIASLGVPERSVTGLMVTKLVVSGGKVKFNSPDLPANPAFDLVYRDSQLVGTMTLGDKLLQVVFRRAGEAKVEVPTPSPAVSKQLEGDWEGGLAMPEGKSRALVFHFHNQPDHTVLATLDSPSQGARDLGLGSVVQNGQTVEFVVRIHGGQFKGTLNPEGTELNGEWVQSADTPPLVCKMKKK